MYFVFEEFDDVSMVINSQKKAVKVRFVRGTRALIDRT